VSKNAPLRSAQPSAAGSRFPGLVLVAQVSWEAAGSEGNPGATGTRRTPAWDRRPAGAGAVRDEWWGPAVGLETRQQSGYCGSAAQGGGVCSCPPAAPALDLCSLLFPNPRWTFTCWQGSSLGTTAQGGLVLPSARFSPPVAQSPCCPHPSLSLVQVKLLSGHWSSWLSKDT